MGCCREPGRLLILDVTELGRARGVARVLMVPRTPGAT